MHLNVSLLSNLTLSRLTRLRNNGSRATPMGHGYWGLQARYLVITPVGHAYWGLQARAPCVCTALHVHSMHTACTLIVAVAVEDLARTGR